MSKENCKNCGELTRRTIGDEPYCRNCQKSFSAKEIEEILLVQEKKKEQARQQKLKEIILKKIANEPAVICSFCGQTMDKKALPEEAALDGDKFVVVDKCPSCGSVFFNNEELNILLEIVEEKAEENASDSGSSFATGLIIGMASN